MTPIPPNSRRLINDLLTRKPFPNVTEAARALDCTRATLHEQLTGRREMSPAMAIRIARLLERSTLEVLAATQYHQARAERDKALWLELWQIAKQRERVTL